MTRSWCERCEQHLTLCRCTTLSTEGFIPVKCHNCDKNDVESVVLCTKCQIAPYKEIDSWRQKWSVATAAKVAVEANLHGLMTEVTELPHYLYCQTTVTEGETSCNCPIGKILRVIKEMP